MRPRLFQTCLFLLMILCSTKVLCQEQAFDGCLNYKHLYELHRGDVLSMGKMLGKERFFMVSNDNNVSFVRQNDTLQLSLCNWQFSMGFNDIYVNAFYKDGFYNFVEYNTTPNCAQKLWQECKDKHIEQYGDSIQVPSNEFIFAEGHHIVFPSMEQNDNQALIQCFDPTNFEQLIRLSKTQHEQEQVAYQIKEQTILRNMAAADSLAQLENYPEAISLLEEVYDVLPEYIGKVDAQLGIIKKQYKEKKIQTYTEKGEKLYDAEDYEGAMEMFSKVLKEDINNQNANERIAAITRKLDVLHQRGQVTYAYQESNPTNYEDFRSALASELNHLIDNTDDGSLKLDFTILFDTLSINQSFFNITAFNTVAIEKNRSILENNMSNLLGDKILQPSYREGIPIRATANFNIDMNWNKWTLQITKKRKKIVNHSAYDINPEILNVLESDPRMYYGTYQFETKSKTVNGKNYHDIQLTKYKTVGGEAFIYGLFPGLGTLIATQGKEGAVNMALSLMFYGGAIASYVLYKDYKKQYDETSTTLNEKNAKNLNTKKEVCKWASIGGVSIGGSIQLGGMIKALVRGIQNKKASKELRQALKNEPIEIQKEDIHIQ